MTKTNEKFRSDLANEYRGNRLEVHRILEFMTESGLSIEDIKKARKRLISNLQSKLLEENGYEESKLLHRLEHKEEGLVGEEKESIITRIRKFLSGVFGGKQEASKKHELPKLYGKYEISKFLKKCRVIVDKNAEMMGYKGEIVEIYLPEAGKDYAPVKYFISYDDVPREDFEKNPELQEKSYSMKEVGGLLRAMNKCMILIGSEETDGYMDYENDLKFWKEHYGSYAGDCLKRVVGLKDMYRLNDKNVDQENSLTLWSCLGADCCFIRDYYNNFSAKLLLRLS